MRRLLLPAIAAAVFAMATPTSAADEILVFAAASLQESLTAVADSWASAGNPRPKLSFAASSILARQIENGAPASIFVSADEQWMDYLAGRRLIDTTSRRSLLGNRLVLVAPVSAPLSMDLRPGCPLAEALGAEKLALADTESVPAGRYAMAALTKLGIWKQVEGRVVRAADVRAALALVERGEARAGVVYATDAAASKKVVLAGTFPESSHPPIVYPLAIVAGRAADEAKAFAAFLASKEASALFERYGFLPKR